MVVAPTDVTVPVPLPHETRSPLLIPSFRGEGTVVIDATVSPLNSAEALTPDGNVSAPEMRRRYFTLISRPSACTAATAAAT